MASTTLPSTASDPLPDLATLSVAPPAVETPLSSSAPLEEPSTASTESSTTATPLPPKKAKKIKPRIVLQGTPDEILARNTASAPPVISARLIKYAHKHWSKFYTNHASSHSANNGFFKNRHWCEKEWNLAQVLDPNGDAEDTEREGKGEGKKVLETGCGTGAFVYPLLERYPAARFVAFDFAQKAVELTKAHPLYLSSPNVFSFQHDLTAPLPLLHEKLSSAPASFSRGENVKEFDIVSCIFVLSAIAPSMMQGAVETLLSLLAPGGSLLFRDYAFQDAAQLRFHSLPSASYASTPSLLSARVAPTPSSASPVDEAQPSSSSPSSAPSAAGFSTLAAVSSPPAASEPSAPPPVHRELPNLAWYTRGDHTTSYFYKEDEVQLLISRALSSLNAKKREAGEAEVVLEGGTTMHEREMFNRKEDWGCTRRFVGGRWTRVQ